MTEKSSKIFKALDEFFTKKALSINYLFVYSVWCVFFSLTMMLYIYSARDGVCVWRYWMTMISSATIFTIPLFWCKPRWRWSLWVAISVLTIYIFCSLVYQRNFGSLMPLNSIFQAGNIDDMVLQSAFATFRWYDIWLVVPLIALIVLWFCVFRKHLRHKSFSIKSARKATIYGLALWLLMQIIATTYFAQANPYRTADFSTASFLKDAKAKFKGKLTLRTNYLYYNGLDVYLIWSLEDFFPQIKLDKQDRKFIQAYTARQDALYAQYPIMANPYHKGNKSGTHPNFLLIMVESLENWPLEYEVDGKPCLQYMQSLISAPGTLYFPHLLPQISLGHSSDGHLIDLTGILPLRDLATNTDFYENEYPSIFKAYKQKYGGSTFEIISDKPNIWHQDVTYKYYGFDKLYIWDDIDPQHISNWSSRDSYLGKYVSEYLQKIELPFAGMAVTLSLHTPYRSKISGHPEIDALNIDDQSKHYLKVCKNDEEYISWIINSLKRRGIYDNTVIAITGDHNAFGLFDSHRPPQIAGKEQFIPLIILNSGYERHTYPEIAGQIDIYPTLLDVLGLNSYSWKGVGMSLLRYTPQGATRRNGIHIGHSDSTECLRQKQAWDVSDLMIRSNYFVTK